MFDAQTLLVFSLAAALFAVFPGPAVIYIVTRSVAQGRRAGVLSAVGIETGNLVATRQSARATLRERRDLRQPGLSAALTGARASD